MSRQEAMQLLNGSQVSFLHDIRSAVVIGIVNGDPFEAGEEVWVPVFMPAGNKQFYVRSSNLLVELGE